MKPLAILAVCVSLSIGSAAYLTTTQETRIVTIEVPYQVPVYEDVNVSYQEPIYKTVEKTNYVQKTETKYKDETRYRTVTRYGSVTYYSGWLQIVYASKIYFSKATGANCEPAGLSIGVSEMYTCTIIGGPDAGTYTPVVLYNIDEETERVPQQVKEAYKVQIPYEVTVNVPETVQEQVIDHYETKYKTEKRIKGYETKHRTETGEVTKTKFEWLFSPKITSLDDNNIPKISTPTPTATTLPAISFSETRVLRGASSGNYYYKVIPEGFTIYLSSDIGGILSFKVWNDQGICYYCNTDNTLYYSDSSLRLNTTAKDVNERFTSSIYNTKRELIGDDKILLSQGIAGGKTVEIKVSAGTSKVTLTTIRPNYNMFMEISDIIFTSQPTSVAQMTTPETTSKSISSQKTLAQGETWDIGGGWTLRANSIDAKASPKQVWLTLSKNGIKLDDKVLAEGQIYNYNVFSTKIASIYSGPTSDIVALTDTLIS